ncbi:hypothetical protein BDD12DRAFT_865149 [Trichophaea hybrida]|nr:hypothetical protein BDD12DRAFT_865149 [Trichophaea hybrida]
MSDENHGEKISNITIDPNGDVSALMVCPVYGTSISARVSSKCLSLASSVFSAMLGPQSMFLEGTQLRSAAQLELNLDDNGEAMLNILKLLHHKNKNVPRELDIEMLYETAIIVDKYDLLEAIRPWIIIWFDPYREKISDSVSSPEVWVDISWVFEDTCMFKEISRHLILETCIDSNEDLITREGHKVGEIVPDGIHGESGDSYCVHARTDGRFRRPKEGTFQNTRCFNESPGKRGCPRKGIHERED